MASKKKPDWPPAGWKIELKVKNGRKYKYYINLKTHQKFYSKTDVLRYIKDGCVSNEKSQAINEHAKSSGMHVVEAHDYEWLPTGWVIERRIRKSGARAGTEYKCYIDPSTEAKFFSKPEVLRYIGSKQCSAGSSKRKDGGDRGHSSSKRSIDSLSAQKSNVEPKVSQISKSDVRKSLSSGKLKVVTEKIVDEELPSGWIKELRIKMLGNKVVRRDPFYPDPASRLVFRSKLEVLRYLETGEISRHAFQRKSGSIIDEGFAIEKTSTTSSGRREPNSTGRKKDRKLCSVPSRFSKRLAGVGAESASNFQEMVLAKPLLKKVSETEGFVGMTNRTQEFQDADTKDDTVVRSEPSSAPSRATLQEDKSVHIAIEDCSNGKAQNSTRRTKDRKLRSVPSCSYKQLAGGFGAESASNCQELALAKPLLKKVSGTKRTIGMTNHTPPEFQDADKKDDTVKGTEPSSALPRGVLPEEKPVETAIEDCSIGKSQISTRKPEDWRSRGVPSRSSKRLAGVDAEVVFHPIPIEHALQAAKRKSSRTKPTTYLESVPNELQEIYRDVDTQDLNEHATSVTPSGTKLVPSLESVSNELQEKCQDIDMQDVLSSHETQEQCHTLDVDPEHALATQGEPLNMIDNLTSQEEQRHTLDVDSETVLASQEPSNNIDDLTFEDEKHRALDVDLEIVFTTQGGSPYKIDDLTFEEEKHNKNDVHTETLLASQGEPLNKIDDWKAKYSLVDLNDLQLDQAPPGFCENTKAEASSGTIKQLAYPTVLGTKVENTSRGQPILQERSEEQLAGIKREPEQPQSELCFSSSLWSDPCLEFAYKTLTGAITFDDNLAIDDYIQHQLRTSKPCKNSQCPPDICAPTFKNDEAKLVSESPEDANFPNSNGFVSPVVKQVKHK